MRFLSLGVLLFLTACGGDAPADGGSARAPRTVPRPADPTAAEAQELGRELFGIMDKVMAYKSDHFNQLPKSLPALGVDSLTRTTVRRLTITDGVPSLVVAYRRPDGRTVASCTGTNAVLEDSMLNGGAFDVHCTLRSGEAKSFTVGG